MVVSGEFKYFGPAFSSVESVRPVNAITRPLSFAIGNVIRLRNLEYIEAGFRLWASGCRFSLLPLPSSALSSRAEPDDPLADCPAESRDLLFACAASAPSFRPTAAAAATS